MDNDERKKIAAALADADEATLREIVREAESYLDAQLKSGLEADKRAMTLAAILAAVISFMVGGTASMIAAEVPIWPQISGVFILVGFLIAALFAAIHAARPTPFGYVGNDPKFWVADVANKKPLKVSLAEQASFYSRDISANADCLDENHRCVRRALTLALMGILFGTGVELILLLAYWAQHGFRFGAAATLGIA
jgi:hypothetical protein